MRPFVLGGMLLAIVFILATVTYYAARRKIRNVGERVDRPVAPLETEFRGERFLIQPQSVTAARAKKTGLPSTGSEDVSRLLVPPAAERSRGNVVKSDYRPDAAIDWIIDVEYDGDPVFEANRIREIFDRAWRKSHGEPTVYGWSPEIARWTYLDSGDAPKNFSKLTFGWSLHDSVSESPVPLDADNLAQFQSSVDQLSKWLGNAHIRANRSPAAAAKLSQEIGQLVQECNRDVTVVLVAPRGKSYAGRDVWDVMLSLGLRWGDMDLFHWRNDSGEGDDAYFSVWTSTPPGYFLPELIAADRVQVADLAFGYSIPRSHRPEMIFDSMLKAIEYAQRRLGGEIQGTDGRRLDPQTIRTLIRSTVEKMESRSFTPGKDATLRVF